MATRSEAPPASPYQAYLEESTQPLAGLVFALPLFITYHIGISVFQRFEISRLQNGADVLLRKALNAMGLGGPLIGLAAVVLFFSFRQLLWHRPFRLKLRTFGFMLLESVVFALPPFLLAKLVAEVLLAASTAPTAALASTVSTAALSSTAAAASSASAASAGPAPWGVDLVLVLGAGVYEEFLFRVLVLGLFFLAGRKALGLKGGVLYAWTLLPQALLFAAFHHMPGSVEPFALDRFAFRTLAGLYFGWLYTERGFGVTAGAHAVYDVIAVSLNAFR
jgi:hypothetical protein